MSIMMSSEDSRKAYLERKTQVLSLLDKTKEYYLKEEEENEVEVFSKLYEDVKNEEFSIVVVGEFSAGKSTLLNALMGKRILPSFSNETTATVNFLRHSEKAENGEAGRVFYTDGKQEILKDSSLDTIMKYVSTKGDDVAKKVEHLDLYLDSDFLKDGVTLVDSPGLNGIADGHREITEKQIEKSHASIFLFNSDHPGSKTDFEFLYELQKKVKTIIFVLNKIDEIKEEEGETPQTVIETLKKSYKEKFPEITSIPEIWPVAAFPALVARNKEALTYHGKTNRTEEEKLDLEKKSRLKEFEDRLLQFLTCGEKTKEQLLSPVDKVIKLSKGIKEKYEQEKDFLSKANDTVEIDNKIINIKENIEGLEKQIFDIKKDVTAKLKNELKETLEEINAKISRLQEYRLNEIENFEDLEELITYLNGFEKLFMNSITNILLNQDEELRERIISQVKLYYTSQSDIIENKLMDKNINLKEISVSNHLNTDSKVIEVGLKEMNIKIKELEEKIEILEKEANEAEKNAIKQRKQKRIIDEMKTEIKNLEEKKEMVENTLLPAKEKYFKEVIVEKDRKGVFGFLGEIFFGKREVPEKKLIIDDTEYKIAKESQAERSKELTEKINKSKDELKIKELENENLEIAELEEIKKKEEVTAAINKLEKLIKENTEKIEIKNNKEINKIKRELKEWCEIVSDELNSKIKKLLRNSEKEYVEIILEIVRGAINKELKDKQQYLEKLEKQLSESEENKSKRIEKLDEKIENINIIMEEASDLYVELSSIPVDEIKIENI